MLPCGLGTAKWFLPNQRGDNGSQKQINRCKRKPGRKSKLWGPSSNTKVSTVSKRNPEFCPLSGRIPGKTNFSSLLPSCSCALSRLPMDTCLYFKPSWNSDHAPHCRLIMKLRKGEGPLGKGSGLFSSVSHLPSYGFKPEHGSWAGNSVPTVWLMTGQP
jgi:hypothetical protein